MDEKIVIKLSGFKPRQEIKVKAQAGNWSSYGIFQADSSGNVDLSKQAPISGTYKGIDGMGLIWSLKRSDKKSTGQDLKPFNGFMAHQD